MRKVIVIGAGAAGLMAAWSAAEEGAEVLLLEQNEKAGKKIYITGKGRCNLTNNCLPEEFFQSVVSNPKFLYHAVYGFGPADMMEMMEANGCHVKTERGSRVFPVSDHASDVTAALVRAIKRCGVSVRYETPVKEVLTETRENGTRYVRGIKTAFGEVFEADAVIVCTGGLSYPATGSRGDGYRFAKEAGHSIVKTQPALVPIETAEKWCTSLQGLSLKNVGLSAYPAAGKKARKPLFCDFGEMLFTHFGISGPLVLSLSSFLDFTPKGQEGPVRYDLFLDLKPALSSEQLIQRIKREFEAAPSRAYANILRTLFPSRLSDVMAGLSGIDPARRASSINDREIAALAALTQAVPMTAVRKRGYNEAVVTSGGVSVREIDPASMESRKAEGLYFAGEVMDVDAKTGGFNLQIAWSTGRLAGISAAAGRGQ